MKAKAIISFVIILLSFTFCQSSCTAKQHEEALKARAREIHDEVLTVDTHCDTPMRMARGEWDMGKRHEPGQRRSGKIDLPRRKRSSTIRSGCAS